LPITPLLIPEIATGAAPELDELREAARVAVEWADPQAVLVPDIPVNSPDWSLDGFGLTVGTGTPVGLAEGIARWLLAGRAAEAVGPSADLSGFTGVLVMGDGSSSRTEKAPGHLHPDAVPFDEKVLAALGDGDAAALADLDDVGVGASGVPAWQPLGRAVESVSAANIDHMADPYGVLYVVARWTVRWAVRA